MTQGPLASALLPQRPRHGSSTAISRRRRHSRSAPPGCDPVKPHISSCRSWTRA